MFVHALVLSRFSHGTSSRFRASLVAQLVKNPSAMWDCWVQSLGWEDPLEKGMATHSSILGLPWLVKNLPAMWETWGRSLGWEDPLERGMATLSSILAWKTVHGVAKSWT